MIDRESAKRRIKTSAACVESAIARACIRLAIGVLISLARVNTSSSLPRLCHGFDSAHHKCCAPTNPQAMLNREDGDFLVLPFAGESKPYIEPSSGPESHAN